ECGAPGTAWAAAEKGSAVREGAIQKETADLEKEQTRLDRRARELNDRDKALRSTLDAQKVAAAKVDARNDALQRREAELASAAADLEKRFTTLTKDQ